MRSTLSILGLFNYAPDIFDNFAVPDGVDAGTVLAEILLQCAELEIIYPEPETMKTAITSWTTAELPIWRKLYATTQFDYNPIWNKDGVVRESEVNTYDHSSTESEGEKGRSSGISRQDGESSSDQTTKVAAYDASDFANREKVGASADSKSTQVDTGESSIDRDRTSEEKENRVRNYERIEQGNIGVTTTQQMIREEREVDQFNIIDYIVQSFKRRFCLLVY